MSCLHPRQALWLCLAALGGFFVVSGLLVVSRASSFDALVFEWAAGYRASPLGRLLAMASPLGSPAVLVGVAMGATAALAIARAWWRTLLPVPALLVAYGGNLLLKCTFLRERPVQDAIGAVFSACDVYAFPSAHAMVGGALYGVLACVAWGFRTAASRVVAGALALAAMAGGASRVVTGVHWASDVIAGWLMGATLVALVALTWHGLARWATSKGHPM